MSKWRLEQQMTHLIHFEDRAGVAQIDEETNTIELFALTTDVRVAMKKARRDGAEISGLQDCSLLNGGTIEVN